MMLIIQTQELLLYLEELHVARNMPKMKVIDFLTSIFKMFNLTAFYDDRRILANGTTNADYDKIKVMTLDDFYSEGTRLHNR